MARLDSEFPATGRTLVQPQVAYTFNPTGLSEQPPPPPPPPCTHHAPCTWTCPHRDFTSSRVPRILRDKDVTVIDKHGNYITIRNPLASFKYPVSCWGS